MTIDEYLAALKVAIRSLPEEEIAQALGYYDEYLHDATDPAAAMQELGTPKEVAATILAGYVNKTSSRPRISVLWAVVLGILAAPIAAPMAVVGFVIVLALLIVLFSVLLSLLASGVGIGITGIGAVVTGFYVLVTSPSTGLTLVGVGLLMAAIGLILAYGIIQLGLLCVAGLARFVANATRRAK